MHSFHMGFIPIDFTISWVIENVAVSEFLNMKLQWNEVETCLLLTGVHLCSFKNLPL